MKIQYLAHASFLVTTRSGTRVVTDPFDPKAYPGAMNYRAFDDKSDIVTISHDHPDHAAKQCVKGSPIIIRGNGKFQANEVDFIGVETAHDEDRGERRGKNTAFVMEVDDLRIAHMGDLGHVLTSDQASQIGAVDVIMVPVGGYYTIDAKQAETVAEQLEARIILPMHYRTKKCSFPIASVDEFTQGKANVTRPGKSTLDVTKDTLPNEPRIVILDYSL